MRENIIYARPAVSVADETQTLRVFMKMKLVQTKVKAIIADTGFFTEGDVCLRRSVIKELDEKSVSVELDIDTVFHAFWSRRIIRGIHLNTGTLQHT